MAERTYSSKALGLELDSTHLKAALVTQQRNNVQIQQLFTFSLEEPHKHSEHHVNPLELAEDGKSFLNLTGKTLIVTAVNANETLIRPLDIKLKKDKDIDAVLLFQAEPLLPYPIENAVVDRVTLSKDAQGTQLTLLGVRKDHLQHHILQWQPLNIEPEIVVSIPAALTTFSNLLLPESPLHFVLHLGEKQTCCIFVKNGKLIAAQSSSFDINNLKQTFAKEMQIEDPLALDDAFENADWTSVANDEHSLASAAIRNFHMEVHRMVYSLVRQMKMLEVPDILLTGDAAPHQQLLEAILGSLVKSIVSPQPPEGMNLALPELQTHAIPIGSALMAIPNYQDQVNFRQGDFAYPNPWKRLVKPIATFVAMVGLLTGASYFFGHAYLKSKETDIRKSYAQLLISANKPYLDAEMEFANRGKKNPSTAPIDLIPIETLSLPEIQARMDFINKSLQAIPDLFPLQPNVPRVSDLLAWLSIHPNVVNKELSPDGPLIQIQNFNYTVAKRPDISKKQEKYQVKVEVEFSAINPTAAREFHDALLSPNAFVDPKGDVKWTTNKGFYKAVFFLKDRTVYP